MVLRVLVNLEGVNISLSLLCLIALYDQFSLSLLTNLLSSDKLIAELPRKRASYAILTRNKARFYGLSTKFDDCLQIWKKDGYGHKCCFLPFNYVHDCNCFLLLIFLDIAFKICFVSLWQNFFLSFFLFLGNMHSKAWKSTFFWKFIHDVVCTDLWGCSSSAWFRCAWVSWTPHQLISSKIIQGREQLVLILCF